MAVLPVNHERRRRMVNAAAHAIEVLKKEVPGYQIVVVVSDADHKDGTISHTGFASTGQALRSITDTAVKLNIGDYEHEPRDSGGE